MNEQRVSSVFDGDPEQVKALREARVANQKAMLAWIGDSLKEGVDFGKIHKSDICTDRDCKIDAHYSKECLLKPGAEKIQGYLGLTARFDLVKGGGNETAIIVKSQLFDQDGRLVGEGMGARETREDNNLNTSIKMAEKSAFVDAILRTACLSEVFTQDLDTMQFKPRATAQKAARQEAPAPETASVQQGAPAANAAPASPPKTPAAIPAGGKNPEAAITPAQKAMITKLFGELNITEAGAKKRLAARFGESCASVGDLNRAQASEIIKLLGEAKKHKTATPASQAAPSAA